GVLVTGSDRVSGFSGPAGQSCPEFQRVRVICAHGLFADLDDGGVLVTGSDRVSGHSGPVNEIAAGGYGCRMPGSPGALVSRHDCGALIAGCGRVPVSSCPGGHVAAGVQGENVVRTHYACDNGQKRVMEPTGSPLVSGLSGPPSQHVACEHCSPMLGSEFALAILDHSSKLVAGRGRVAGLAGQVGQLAASVKGIEV